MTSHQGLDQLLASNKSALLQPACHWLHETARQVVQHLMISKVCALIQQVRCPSQNATAGNMQQLHQICFELYLPVEPGTRGPHFQLQAMHRSYRDCLIFSLKLEFKIKCAGSKPA